MPQLVRQAEYRPNLTRAQCCSRGHREMASKLSIWYWVGTSASHTLATLDWWYKQSVVRISVGFPIWAAILNTASLSMLTAVWFMYPILNWRRRPTGCWTVFHVFKVDAGWEQSMMWGQTPKPFVIVWVVTVETIRTSKRKLTRCKTSVILYMQLPVPVQRDYSKAGH